MAIIEVKIPSPGESITHVELFHWLVEDGAIVAKDTEIAELESDKATLMLVAYESGKISFKAKEGDMLEVGSVACTIDTSIQPSAAASVSPEPGSTKATSDSVKAVVTEDSSKVVKSKETGETPEKDKLTVSAISSEPETKKVKLLINLI